MVFFKSLVKGAQYGVGIGLLAILLDSIGIHFLSPLITTIPGLVLFFLFLVFLVIYVKY